MPFLYNLLFNFAFLLSAPWYFLKMYRRGGWKDGFGERFGLYGPRLKQSLTNRQTVWFHAVSVGEVNLCTQLIQAIEHRLPLHTIVVSTTTSTGMALLQDRLPSTIIKLYYPIDRRKHVIRAIGIISPSAVVLVEAEIWPNFLWTLQRRGIPHFLVNARLSERSYRGYKRFGFLFRSLFAGFTGVGAQTSTDALRLIKLGCRPETIQMVGSLKFDSARLEASQLVDIPRLLEQIGVSSDSLVLVAGSTHEGEEKILADLTLRLKKQFPSLFLVVVPRHQERGTAVGDALHTAGFRFILRKNILPKTQIKSGSLDGLIVNTTGELAAFYRRADVVFVGKSLTAEGGQNPIEPAALGKAVIFGPNMQNFPEIAPAFVQAGGAIQIADAQELETVIAQLLANPERRRSLGLHALKVVNENQDSIGRTVNMIVHSISP
ncbi:MAG: 3-deoxy-D-manno-octulosonic acid transferase [Pedosphaera sp.]|nr:3-deoxy-D-manno-octulosonic acid transferase [Pedosphaera sp.]